MKKNEPKAAHITRLDRAGHLNPAYVADLRAHGQENATPADDVALFRAIRGDSLAEELGEAYLRAATSGEDDESDVLDQIVPEEEGGPFVTTTSKIEVANGSDASNPDDATREPFPIT